jgi:hypothetical protein
MSVTIPNWLAQPLCWAAIIVTIGFLLYLTGLIWIAAYDQLLRVTTFHREFISWLCNQRQFKRWRAESCAPKGR